MPRFASPSTRRRSLPRPFIVVAILALLAGPFAASGTAAGEPTLTARILLQGHTRVGAWAAIEVRLKNDGPSVLGELRLAGGTQGRTRFGVAVDLPTQSDKTYVLYAQPSAFGRALTVDLVSGGRSIATADVAFVTHDTTQLVVGVIAEKPQGLVSAIDLQPSLSGQPAVIVPLTPADLPDRVQGWTALDRLIWQDIDTSQLRPGQSAALQGWLAGGGRLIIAGGTAGVGVLSALPDTILPYRPTATVDVPAATLATLVGGLPKGATELPALGGALDHGRILAQVGDRVVAAEATYGIGTITILGFDPTTPWIAESKGSDALWRRFLPQRTGGGPVVTTDDSQLVSAVSQLPSLALPPIGGLLALLAGYILLIGPINYLILRRLDRREWAWVTMPILIVAFAVGAYGFGSALRGSDVVVVEVSIVSGAPDTTEGSAQVYLGVFSPTRGTYQLAVPGGALLSSPIVGDFIGGGDGSTLDVLQGDPARVRDLAVGFGSLRTIRAETTTTVPQVHADLAVRDGTLTGTIKNLSNTKLQKAALILGGSVLLVGDIEAKTDKAVSLKIEPQPQFGQLLSDRVVGQVFGDVRTLSEDSQRLMIRHAMVDQLTFDPTFGNIGQLQAEGPVLLAWDDRSILDVDLGAQTPRRTGNVLYFIPVSMTLSGTTTFESDLLRNTIVSADSAFFNKDPFAFNFGAGTATVAYRPIAFEGTLTATRVRLGMNLGGGPFPIGQPGAGGGGVVGPVGPGGAPVPVPVPVATDCPPDAAKPPAGCVNLAFDGIPEVEVFDRTGDGAWVRLAHFTSGATYDLADPAKYVDPGSGTLLVRFVNDQQGGVSFGFGVSITGNVR